MQFSLSMNTAAASRPALEDMKMADKTAVCVDCGQTDLRERMIKSPRGFVHTFTRRCQSTWQSQVEAADNERNAAIARAEAAERRVQELKAQLARWDSLKRGAIERREDVPWQAFLVEFREPTAAERAYGKTLISLLPLPAPEE